jgi:hypothetical protein
MSVSVEWGNEAQTVLYHHYEGAWNWDEFYIILEQAQTMMDSVDHDIDIIIDMRDSHLIPKGTLSHWRCLGDLQRPNTGMTMLVGTNTLVLALHELMVQVFPRMGENIVLVCTLEEAYAIAANWRQQPTPA